MLWIYKLAIFFGSVLQCGSGYNSVIRIGFIFLNIFLEAQATIDYPYYPYQQYHAITPRMWRQLWVPMIIPTLLMKTNGNDSNRTDTVFLRYGGHAEANGGYRDQTTTIKTTEKPTTTTTTTVETTPSTTTKVYEEEATESVVFVPNNPPPDLKDEEDYLYDGHGLRIKDVMSMKTVHDAMNKDFHAEKKDDTPAEDIVFITGKNHDFEKPPPEEKPRRRNNNNNNYNNYYRRDEIEDVVTEKPKLNCKNLNCNNTINSVCGEKFVENNWKTRLFMNDCYFRKVNCGFKYEVNRYKQVELTRCKNHRAHYETPFSFKPRPYAYDKPEAKPKETRRSSSSRRSMAKNLDGAFCSHPCPVTCTDDYDPQCAVSGTGQKRMFLNHCKLDLNSCFYGVVWHKKPLSDCVGGRKADMRQNRGFIGWMQRVGIVDKSGRLVLE
ncbi:hypothetical protein PYW08_012129 [Mythimna loreyi]|uniref:Uncharacterized protein n=1 Tax=Mythimna loreyi TaxID=667449 RepID=A0ACC2Q4D3_9NEOP|nr:hypothetical protein PYW08_012129 [Mythimna loreyi]